MAEFTRADIENIIRDFFATQGSAIETDGEVTEIDSIDDAVTLPGVKTVNGSIQYVKAPMSLFLGPQGKQNADDIASLKTGKANKVSGAESGNFAGLDANGDLTDSDSKASDFATAAQGAKADSAIQTVKVNGVALTPDANKAVDVTITDGAQIGLGLGVSTEAATISDRTATISNFLLLKNMPVTITFNNAINVMGATLNISSTGAKPIFIKGAALQAGVVKADDVVTLVYDGTNWNIIDILTVAVSASDLYVDMGLPSGTKWAVADIDVTTNSGFAEVDGKPSPFKYECSFFSWGNTEGHSPISGSAFDYDFGSSNNDTYAQTPGAALTADAGLSFDAARANLGAPWRDPSIDDFVELFNNIDFVQADGETVIDTSQVNKLVTVNDVVGIYLKSKINSRLLFFACSGNSYRQYTQYQGMGGNYWSRSFYSQAQGRNLSFSSGGVHLQDNSNRFYGFAHRAVQ